MLRQGLRVPRLGADPHALGLPLLEPVELRLLLQRLRLVLRVQEQLLRLLPRAQQHPLRRRLDVRHRERLKGGGSVVCLDERHGVGYWLLVAGYSWRAPDRECLVDIVM